MQVTFKKSGQNDLETGRSGTGLDVGFKTMVDSTTRLILDWKLGSRKMSDTLVRSWTVIWELRTGIRGFALDVDD